MKKSYILRLIVIILLLMAIGLPGLIRGDLIKPMTTEIPLIPPDTLMTVVVSPPGGGDISYLYTISHEGDLSSVKGELITGKNRARSADDFKNSTVCENVHLPDEVLRRLVDLSDHVVESYGFYHQNNHVKDVYEITLWYQGELYEGFLSVLSFPDLNALADALIELSPIPFEEKGFA